MVDYDPASGNVLHRQTHQVPHFSLSHTLLTHHINKPCRVLHRQTHQVPHFSLSHTLLTHHINKPCRVLHRQTHQVPHFSLSHTLLTHHINKPCRVMHRQTDIPGAVAYSHSCDLTLIIISLTSTHAVNTSDQLTLSTRFLKSQYQPILY